MSDRNEPRTEAEPMFYLWHAASNNAIGYGTLQEMVKERDAELEANPGTNDDVLIIPDPAEAAQGAAPSVDELDVERLAEAVLSMYEWDAGDGCRYCTVIPHAPDCVVRLAAHLSPHNREADHE